MGAATASAVEPLASAVGDRREADPGPQVHCPGFVTILMAPHPPDAADDVPDLLNGGVGNGFGDLAGLQLEVSKAAETAEVAQHPDR